jgi:hypothetical protein
LRREPILSTMGKVKLVFVLFFIDSAGTPSTISLSSTP